ncbi:hypothetical protein R5R35_006943 [Gryllus longicercus]|uniref:Uncharacterized protein n=1 Tax=Gryllus longicercus TaxID=2509291 RepID=A0AAN9YYF3_9ORTH
MAPSLLPALCAALCAALVLAAASRSAKALEVNKCCGKGARLRASEDECVPRPGLAPDATKWEALRAPPAAPWLPASLRARPLDVYYGALADGDAASTETQRRRWVSARVDAEQEDVVKRFLEVDSSKRRFVLDVFPFRNVLPFAVKRQMFCFDTTDSPETPKVILTIVELRAINKCCPKGYRLDKNAEKCEPHQTLSAEDLTEEILDPSESSKSGYWLPRQFMNSVTAVVYDQEPLLKWNVLINSFSFAEHGFHFKEYEDNEEHYNTFDELMRGKTNDKSKPFLWRFVEDESEYKLWVRGISRTGSIVEGTSSEFCFDRTVGNLLPPRVVLARVWTLQKCCSRGERLNAEATRCQARSGLDVKDAAIEELQQIEAAQADHWVPEALRGRKLLVEYLRWPDRKWFPKRQVTAADGDAWSLRDTSTGDPELLVRPQGDGAGVGGGGGGGVQVRNFCFDVAGDGSLAPRVLLSVFPEVNKCCGKDEQLDVRGSKCVPLWGNHRGGDAAGSEIINPEKDPVSASWLPAKLRKNLLPVRYNYGLVENGGVVFLADHEDHLKLHFRSDGKLSFSIFSTTLTGKRVTQRVCQVCFDSIKGQPVALVADVCFLQDFSCFFKCCSSGKLLSAEGLCVDNNDTDWSPQESAASVFLEGHGIYGAKALTHPICGTSPFYIQKPPDTAKEFAEILQNRSRIHRFSKSFFCADKLSAGGGEALAYCLAPPLAPTYEAVRPLGVAAAVLLGAALAAILRRDATRRSAHGRALACHAACLLAANATQAAWFFLDRDDAYCKYYAYAIYFFMVAAGTWLNAISINLARGFKRPVGALAGGAPGGGGRCAGFALLSAWAWGAAVALTALCVAAHGNAQRLSDAGLYAPSLFETRTCFFEVVYTERQRRGAFADATFGCICC